VELPLDAPLEFQDRCTPGYLLGLEVDSTIGAFGRYAPEAARRQLGALVHVASLREARVLVAHSGSRLVAYLTFHPPSEESRWAVFPPGQVVELGGIEVARGVRGRGVAKRLLHLAFSSPDYTRAIVFAEGLTWCWDLAGNAMGVAQYRHMILQLFSSVGFEPFATDEPNIAYDRASVLLVRVGSEASPSLVQQFKASLLERKGS
jgi:acetoin utilization protein AcuA